VLETILTVIAIAGAAAATILATRAGARRSLARAREEARRVVEEAGEKARLRQQDAELLIEERKAAAESQFETQTRRKRLELQQAEERLKEQERNLARRLHLLDQKQQEIDEREARVKGLETAAAGREREAQALLQERRQRLERLAGQSTSQARRELIREIETEARQEAATLVRRIEDEAREEAGARARRLLAEAIQLVPPGEILDNVVTPVRLPSDDMKGRIIGKEGRNIRAIEMATGVDLVVDDTPLVILLSSYDSFRRAVARTAIERLIEDGRIHPGRIEEVVARARADMEEGLEPSGEAAAFELGITGLAPRLTRLLGRLRYRVIQGYNLLDHSLSVARLAHHMATLLGIPPEPLRRAGLLHEIGQVEEGDGHPLLVAADLAAKFGEEARVVGAIRGLHGAGPDSSVEAALLRVAETLVVARPGEQDQGLQEFVERLHRLEALAASFTGVSRVFAMRSGREVRVIVEAASVNDGDVVSLSKEITSRIQTEVEYPGSIKISVIRETRAVDYAT
jgi:ribonuclease Y